MFAIIYAVLISILLRGVYGRSLPELQEIVTTIETEKGQVYDCVNFYKQPALTHPLFKNLTKVQRPNEDQLGEKRRGIAAFSNVDGCPSGTVQILRDNGLQPRVMSPTNINSKIYTAVVRTKIDPNKKFLGAGGSPTIYNPIIGSPTEWSAARMKLQNGPESIEVGWMVNRGLFNDDETHLYIGQSTCLNTQCPGFVHVGEAVPLGVKADHYSEYGAKQQYFWKFFIDKHEDDGNWWVSMNDDKYGVGYWPKSLFSGLADAATQVEWGGEVGADPQLVQQFIYPQMGNGRRAVYKPKYSAIFLNVTVVHAENRQSTEPDNTQKFMDWRDQYTVLDAGHRKCLFWALDFVRRQLPSVTNYTSN